MYPLEIDNNKVKKNTAGLKTIVHPYRCLEQEKNTSLNHIFQTCIFLKEKEKRRRQTTIIQALQL